MSKHQQSFSIKSTHRFVNPPQESQDSGESENTYYSSIGDSPAKRQKGWTNTDTDRKEGSQKGLAIRTTNTSIEDFY